jgi:ElaB/YqjD/DUF883 family membrane-anchored ribosome-binding protein
MADNRTSGDDLGRTLRDAKQRAEGVPKKAKEAAQDVADSGTDALTQTASSFERLLRKMIEQQPYTALFVGIGIGWVLGRSHRPF